MDHYASQLEIRKGNNLLGIFSHLDVVLARTDSHDLLCSQDYQKSGVPPQPTDLPQICY